MRVLYGILQLLRGSHLDNFLLKTLKLGWVAFHSLTFQPKCLNFQSNRYKKLAPVLLPFCNWLRGSSIPVELEIQKNCWFSWRENLTENFQTKGKQITYSTHIWYRTDRSILMEGECRKTALFVLIINKRPAHFHPRFIICPQ